MPIDAANSPRKYTTISIPTPLFQQVEKKIEGTGFRSATEFIVYVTRVAITEENAQNATPPPAGHPRRLTPDAPAREEMPYR